MSTEEAIEGEGDLAVVRRVLASRRDELLARAGVTGVGVGRDEEAGRFVIVCYLESDRYLEALPAAIEGIRVRPEVTGEFRAK